MAIQSGKEASASNERLWREQLGQLVSVEELQSLSEQSLPDTFAAIGGLWVEVAIILTAVNLLPRLALVWAIPAGIVLVLMMGLRMNAFGVILHEGSHGLLAKTRTLNDRICNWGIAFWTINSVEEYRPTHRLHHRYLGQERDPDRVFYLVPFRRGALTISHPPGSPRGHGIPESNHSNFGHVAAVRSAGQLADQTAATFGKVRHAAGRLGSVPGVSGSGARNPVLRGLLARTDRLHVSDDPALEDDHRAF